MAGSESTMDASARGEAAHRRRSDAITARSLDERIIARSLVQRFSAEIPSWQSGGGAAWLFESYTLARQDAYLSLPGFACADDLGSQRIELPEAYVARARELIPEQLAKSGARIAYLLNRAFAK